MSLEYERIPRALSIILYLLVVILLIHAGGHFASDYSGETTWKERIITKKGTVPPERRGSAAPEALGTHKMGISLIGLSPTFYHSFSGGTESEFKKNTYFRKTEHDAMIQKTTNEAPQLPFDSFASGEPISEYQPPGPGLGGRCHSHGRGMGLNNN